MGYSLHIDPLFLYNGGKNNEWYLERLKQSYYGMKRRQDEHYRFLAAINGIDLTTDKNGKVESDEFKGVKRDKKGWIQPDTSKYKI